MKRRTLIAAAALPGLARPTHAAEIVPSLNVFVPAAPGGGWDGLARAIETVARPAGLVGRFGFENLAGGAGTVGLARFLAQRRGRTDSLFVGGASLVGGAIASKSPVSLRDVIPVARLTEEAAVIVVPRDSRFRDVGALAEALRTEPRGIPIAGGGVGTVDHVMLGLIFRALGRRPLDAQFVAFAGGGATQSALMGGHVAAVIAGWGEFSELVKGGRVRALATTGETRLDPAVPTLRESGLDVVSTNWRGIFAAPGIPPAAREALARFATGLHDTPAWRELLDARGWADAFLAGPAFDAFLDRDHRATEEVLRDLGLA